MFATWWILLGLGPWCMVKCVVNVRWIFLKRLILRRKLRRIPQTTYLLRIFTENFAGKTSPAKIHQQNLASYLHLRNRCVALVGTYTNMHVHQYGLGNT